MRNGPRRPASARRPGDNLALLPALLGKPGGAPVVDDLGHRHRVRPFEREVRAVAMRVAAHAPGLVQVVLETGPGIFPSMANWARYWPLYSEVAVARPEGRGFPGASTAGRRGECLLRHHIARDASRIFMRAEGRPVGQARGPDGDPVRVRTAAPRGRCPPRHISRANRPAYGDPPGFEGSRVLRLLK